MEYVKINTHEDIIDCILSPYNIFSFPNKMELTSNLNAIEFFEQEEHTHHDVFGSYFWFSGNIDNVPISITVTKQYNKDA